MTLFNSKYFFVNYKTVDVINVFNGGIFIMFLFYINVGFVINKIKYTNKFISLMTSRIPT